MILASAQPSSKNETSCTADSGPGFSFDFFAGGANQRTRPGEELRKIQTAFYHELTRCRVVQTPEKEEKLLYWSAPSSTVTNTRPFRQKFKKKCDVYQKL